MNIKTLVAVKYLLPVGALAFSALAVAQVQPAGPEGDAAAAAPAPAEAPAPNPQVALFVDQQFPAADADKDGTLTAAEFTTWISGLKSAEMKNAGQAEDAAAVKAYADGALATADKDKNGILEKAELVTFFGG